MFQSLSMPPVPEDTARMAEVLFGKGNVYIQLGDAIYSLLKELIPQNEPAPAVGQTTIDSNIRSAMMTTIQYAEGLSNQQMIEALRNRVELKYALHLPLNYPGLDPDTLCEFRRQLYSHSSCQSAFQGLIDRITGIGLFKGIKEQPVRVDQVLLSVCTLTRFEEVVTAMNQALEAVAITNPEWLRQVALPYWYDRYNRKQRGSVTRDLDKKWKSKVVEIAADIQYLLGEIQRTQQPALASLPEIKNLAKIWDEQFVICQDDSSQSPHFEWRLTRCATCQNLNPKGGEINQGCM